jgi:hypothetical protein
MVVIDSIVGAWVYAIGGSDTIFTILSLMFVFMFVFVFYKIAT